MAFKIQSKEITDYIKTEEKKAALHEICSWGVVEKYNETNFKKQMFLSNYIQLEVVLFSIITLCSY